MPIASRAVYALIVAASLVDGISQEVKAGLMGYYTFDDRNNLGKDSSGLNNDAAVFGTLYSALDPFGGLSIYNFGQGFVRVPIDVSPYALPRMTWGAWVLPFQPQFNGMILSSDDGGWDRTLNIGGLSLPGQTSGFYTAFTGNFVIESDVLSWTGKFPLSVDDFVFVAAVYDQPANSMTFYVNDHVFVTQTNFGPSHPFFDIGRNPSFGGPLYGAIVDSVFVYDQALTADEIARIRANGVNPVPEPTTMALAGFSAIVMGVGTWRRRRQLKQPAV